jgi:predicted PurR-regulated permease PerM
MEAPEQIKRVIVGALIFGIFLLSFLMLKPIIIPIIFALLAAYVFAPVYRKVYKWTNRKNLSALIMIIGFILILLIPAIYIVPSLVNQLFQVYVDFQSLNMADIVGKLTDSEITTSLAASIDNVVGQAFSSLLNSFKELLINLPSFILKFSVFLFTFFFAVRDGKKLGEYMDTLSPFSKNLEKKLLKEFKDITNAFMFGQVMVGVIQGLALGAGLLILGVPNVLVLTFAACILSIIPMIGAWTVWLPVSIYLFVNGQVLPAVILSLYGFFFVSTIDNFLRPYILSRRTSLHLAITIIGTIGGLYFFGIGGILLGPLILAYALIIIDFYRKGNLAELFETRKPRA